MKKLALILIPIILVGCTHTITDEDTTNKTGEENISEVINPEPQNVKPAQISDVKVEIKEDPFLISIVIKGEYENNCRTIYKTKIEQIIKERVFKVEISTQDLQGKSLEETVCTEDPVPFEIVEALPTQAIDPGEFTVDVNGVTTEFSINKNTIDEILENLKKEQIKKQTEE